MVEAYLLSPFIVSAIPPDFSELEIFSYFLYLPVLVILSSLPRVLFLSLLMH